MSKSSDLNHEYFEELCALAVLGQISQREYEELLPHLRVCNSCQTRKFEFMEILHEHLPLLDPQKELFSDFPNISFHHSSYRQRFIRRAQEQGIVFTDSTPRIHIQGRGGRQRLSKRIARMLWPLGPRKLAFGTAMVFLGFVFGWLGQRSHSDHSELSVARGEISRLTSELAGLHQRIDKLTDDRQPPRTQVPPSQLLSSKDSTTSEALRAQLALVHHSYTTELARSRSLEEKLQKTSSELASAKGELAELQTKIQGTDHPHETELALKEAKEALEKLNRARSADLSALTAQQMRIRELSEKLNMQEDNLGRERELLVAGRDIRDLMGARSLHIIDVADVDSQGTKRPFGRVFYTEGKSLIFYAYDLERKRKPQERYSYQAWGQRESRSGSAQNLGIFFVDDQTQNRWILKYDDPNVLAEIDAVFVTLEPKGGSPKPKGQQLMYAYLKATPNHP